MCVPACSPGTRSDGQAHGHVPFVSSDGDSWDKRVEWKAFTMDRGPVHENGPIPWVQGLGPVDEPALPPVRPA